MFENIQFFHYQFPLPNAAAIMNRENIRSRTAILPKFADEGLKLSNLEQDDNIKNATFSQPKKIAAFMRPPVQEESLRSLYYMEAFSIFTCGSGFFTRRKDYHSYQIIYTYEGKGRLDYAGKTYHLNPGDGFFIDCVEPHYYCTQGPHWKHSVLHMNGPLLPLLYQKYIKKGTVTFRLPITGHYQKNLEQLLHIYSNASPCRDWEAADCISHMLTELLKMPGDESIQNQKIPKNIQYLITYMENHFSANLTLDSLAEFSGISKYHLSREFKNYTGYSPVDYLIQLRIEHARTLLKSTDMPANKIAHTVGIHDINNFTKLFKKKTGMTPGKFRA